MISFRFELWLFGLFWDVIMTPLKPTTANIHFETIASETGLLINQITATTALLDDDATVPFIARYRKEATGGLDEVAITTIRDRLTQLRELDLRREAIIKSLDERELLSDELLRKIENAGTMVRLEDIYLPFRPKRRTRATIAIEHGLESLAEKLFEQEDIYPEKTAENFVNPENEVPDIESALAGARDIIAGWISEDADARTRLRDLFRSEGIIESKVVKKNKDEAIRYSDYFDWSEPADKAASHRLLAMMRGESKSYLKLHLAPPETAALSILTEMFILQKNRCSEQVRQALEDSYIRLLQPAMANEILAELKKRADKEAISIFAENLRQLLMAPPLGKKTVMAIDPGFQSGCKVVCLDSQGDFDHYITIFPHTGKKLRQEAADEIKALVAKFKINIIAVGNGTAGRETDQFLREINLSENIIIQMVNESGASIYSVSAKAREEFPEFDATVRGAISIGRRLLDPLAELVKIDAQAIGVGEYQHDVDQTALKQTLDDTVSSCVNQVGVDVNRAGKDLLTFVSGLGPKLAGNIVKYRSEHGPFKSRRALMKVSLMGPKAFEQSAGFLRIPEATNPLDQSAVHPESYPVVEKMAKDLSCTVAQLISNKNLRDNIELNKYITDKIGRPTLEDIMEELARPGRDPRKEFTPFSFDASVNTIEDLKVGMRLPGIITNVTSFGVFVDIGVHQDGLVHISELSDSFVKYPTEVVKLHEQVKVTVLEIDIDRRRIALSMKQKK